MPGQTRFGYEWDKYSQVLERHEEQFLEWVSPLKPADFEGRRVMDAGCGMGRNAFWALKYGAKELVGFDLDSRAVAKAGQNLARFPNAKVMTASIYEPPVDAPFDLVFSIGVVHHLPDPPGAVKKLYEATAPGGTLLLWLYGKGGIDNVGQCC